MPLTRTVGCGARPDPEDTPIAAHRAGRKRHIAPLAADCTQVPRVTAHPTRSCKCAKTSAARASQPGPSCLCPQLALESSTRQNTRKLPLLSGSLSGSSCFKGKKGKNSSLQVTGAHFKVYAPAELTHLTIVPSLLPTAQPFRECLPPFPHSSQLLSFK